MLRDAGWHVNHKRVARIWRREGLKVPQNQKKKGRLWLNDGSCVRLRPEHPSYVWSYDFVQDQTNDGRAYRALNIIDEYTREALIIRVERKLNSTDVLDALTDLDSVPGAGVTLFFGFGLAAVSGQRSSPGPWGSVANGSDGFQCHIAPRDRPLIILLQHQGADQARHRGLVGKDSHEVCPPFDLLVQPLEWVRRV